MNANELMQTLLTDIAASGLSVAKVCKKAAIDPSLVSRWKAGRVEPRLSSLFRMRAALEALKGAP
jgi:transcriptional regulator with XRE-family HTH domain